MNNDKRPRYSSGNTTKKAKVTTNPKNSSSQGSGGKVKFNKESFLRSLKDLKLYVEGDRCYDSARVKWVEMDWRAEASALVDDIKRYVNKIELSVVYESNDHKAYFEIETLEGIKLLVLMNACGFAICDNRQTISTEHGESSSVKIYETINSLLDDHSPKFREAFVGDLQKRIQLLEQ